MPLSPISTLFREVRQVSKKAEYISKAKHVLSLRFACFITNIKENVIYYLKIFAALHQVFHIINRWEEKIQDVEKLMFFFWQSRICKQLYHVAKVITTEGRKKQGSESSSKPA